MALEVVVNESRSNRDIPRVTVNGALKRLLINGKAMEEIQKKFGKPVSHLVLLRDPEIERCIWIRAAEPEERGARSLGSTKGSTKLVSCSMLLRLVGYNDETKTVSFPIVYDPENAAFKVDMAEKENEVTT
jgi:hypothetical protein